MHGEVDVVPGAGEKREEELEQLVEHLRLVSRQQGLTHVVRDWSLASERAPANKLMQAVVQNLRLTSFIIPEVLGRHE